MQGTKEVKGGSFAVRTGANKQTTTKQKKMTMSSGLFFKYMKGDPVMRHKDSIKTGKRNKLRV